MHNWIYESPDNGETVYRRKSGSLTKELVKVPTNIDVGLDIIVKINRLTKEQEHNKVNELPMDLSR